MMKLTRFVATSDGGSRFEEIEIPLDIEREGADGYKLMCSEAFTSDCACFVSLPAELDQDWHQAPTRQFVQLIRGTVEVTTTDGEVRRWSSGDQFIAADVSGRGHKTRVIDGPAVVIFMPLPDGFLD
jgi:hypothetical protein